VGLPLGQADITFEEFSLEPSADLPTHLKVNSYAFLILFISLWLTLWRKAQRRVTSTKRFMISTEDKNIVPTLCLSCAYKYMNRDL
jgi:hypothetical protein